MNHRVKTLLCIGAATAILSACGGGGGTDGTGAVQPSALVTSSGAMAKGSVILNGTHYDDSTASVTDDRNRGAAQLDDGMVIKLRGRSSDDGTGVAERIDVENEVRAAIQSIDGAASPQRFTVGGLVVLVDAQTVYENATGFAGLAVGTRVEVHGLRDASGQLRATRVEVVGAAGAEGVDELRGAVSNPDTATDRFTLNGNVTVNYAGATFTPAGSDESALVAGRVVEVRGSFNANGGVFTATHIDVEDLEDDDVFGGAAVDRHEVEGFISGFAGHPGTFQVGGRDVRTTTTTRFEHGIAEDLADNVKVEAEGVVDAQGVLVASKIEFKQTRVILHGRATAVDAAQGTLIVLGQTVTADQFTRIDARSNAGDSENLADIVATDCVQVRGHLYGGAFIAYEIKEPSGCNVDDDLVQAPVTGENEASAVLTFFGSLDASLANAQFRGDDDLPMTREQFLAAVVPASASQPGTLVKVKGTFANGTLTVDEAELED